VPKMPVYEILIDGKPRKVELTRKSEKSFNVKVDGKPFDVELPAEETSFKGQFLMKLGERTYKVELPKVDRDKSFQIKIEEAAFKAEVKTPSLTMKKAFLMDAAISAPMKRVFAEKQPTVEGAVTAPMTGKIISVKVKEGDQVKAGQILCVIEAMKMENEITAPKAGRVREVNVSEGSSVSEGEILFIID